VVESLAAEFDVMDIAAAAVQLAQQAADGAFRLAHPTRPTRPHFRRRRRRWRASSSVPAAWPRCAPPTSSARSSTRPGWTPARIGTIRDRRPATRPWSCRKTWWTGSCGRCGRATVKGKKQTVRRDLARARGGR
jgi:hypothetical protein